MMLIQNIQFPIKYTIFHIGMRRQTKTAKQIFQTQYAHEKHINKNENEFILRVVYVVA